MSKAFTSNDAEDDDLFVRAAPALPPGMRNYITPAGAARMTQERDALGREKAALGEITMEKKAQLARLENRIEFLNSRLSTHVVIDPAQQPKDRILFGAKVLLENTMGHTQCWNIVGIDEIDLEKGLISWISPLANALLNKKLGDTVRWAEASWTIREIA